MMPVELLWNAGLTLASVVGGWFLKVLSDEIHQLREEDKRLADRVNDVALIVAGDYVRKTDFDRFEDALMGRFDRLERKIDER